MRRLHLLIADLFPPPEFVRQALGPAAPPGLGAVLARGRCAPAGADAAGANDAGAGAALGCLLGLGDDNGPAPYLLAAEGQAPGDACWMRLDPAHLRFQRDELYLAEGAACPLTRAEADVLVGDLNRHFVAAGWHCLAPHPQRWYLRLPAPPRLVCQPLDSVAGRSVARRLPQGPDAARWRGLLNEAQMLLHAHPVNQAREDAGLPPVNSVWPWGAGVWRPLAAVGWRGVLGDPPLARALALAGGVPHGAAPTGLAGLPAGDGAWLVTDDSLAAAARYGDPPAWREAIQRLDADWLRPALSALRRGGLGRLVLQGTGAAGRTVTVDAWAAWKVWRRG